jgi:hypothetical protein
VKRTLFAAGVGRVDPEPGADASARRAGRHPSRDLEVGQAVEDTRVVDTEHGKVL